MWEPKGKLLELDQIGDLKPEEILYEFHGEPLTFTALDRDEELLLVQNLCVFDRISRYLVSAIDQPILVDLKSGRVDLLGSLKQPRCWVVDIAEDAAVKALWRADFASIPEQFLPKPGAMLDPDHDPFLRIRLIGSSKPGRQTTAAELRSTIQGAEQGLRRLAEIALDRTQTRRDSTQGKRDVINRFWEQVSLYPEFSFRASTSGHYDVAFTHDAGRAEMRAVFGEMGRLLQMGLEAVRSNDRGVVPIEGLDARQARQVISSVKSLTPSPRRGVMRVETSGWLQNSTNQKL